MHTLQLMVKIVVDKSVPGLKSWIAADWYAETEKWHSLSLTSAETWHNRQL